MSQCLGDVNEWAGVGLNDMWMEPDGHVAWKKDSSRVAPNGLNILLTLLTLL